jgi:hypothetical protein
MTNVERPNAERMPKELLYVIPAQAGTQLVNDPYLDPRLRGDDGSVSCFVV